MKKEKIGREKKKSTQGKSAIWYAGGEPGNEAQVTSNGQRGEVSRSSRPSHKCTRTGKKGQVRPGSLLSTSGQWSGMVADCAARIGGETALRVEFFAFFLLGWVHANTYTLPCTV